MIKKIKKSKTKITFGKTLITLLLFIGFFVSVFPLLTFIDNNISFNTKVLRNHILELWFGLSILFTIGYFLVFYKREDYLRVSKAWLIILYSSFLLYSWFAYQFGNSNLWYLKYTVGIYVGTLSFLFNRKKIDNYSVGLAGVFSLLIIFFCERAEYFFILDPSEYPTLLDIESFSNPAIWFLFLMIVILPSLILSKGFFIRLFFKDAPR